MKPVGRCWGSSCRFYHTRALGHGKAWPFHQPHLEGGRVAVRILVIDAAGSMPHVASNLIAGGLIVPSAHHMSMDALRAHDHDPVAVTVEPDVLICRTCWRG